MRILLHTCCGPCASHCVLALREMVHDVTMFFSNANIAPDAEFQKRLDNAHKLAACLDVPVIAEEPDHSEWLDTVAKGFEKEPEKGARCDRCFRYSLERTCRRMEQEGFDMFTSTLSVSPHKHTPTLFKIGRELDSQKFLAVNFKQGDGFKNSLRLSEQFGLYRQNYCGCEFSRNLTTQESGISHKRTQREE